MVRRLDECNSRIAYKPADSHLQEAAYGDMVAVENGNKFPVHQPESMVDVAGFGMVVLLTLDVADAGSFGEGAKFRAAAVVKNPDMEFVRRPVHRKSTIDSGLDDFKRFVVGRDANVHMRPC